MNKGAKLCGMYLSTGKEKSLFRTENQKMEEEQDAEKL